MRQALELAAKGRFTTAPNPMVGAVLVRAGRVVGKGWHRRFGGSHAEVEAIRDAGKAARGADLYVTMEPCCFCGKTGACTDALRAAGIRRVFAATLDPHYRVKGEGARCLRRAGVEVQVGLLGREARALNEAYFTYHEQHRPLVVLKAALTLDGMLADRRGVSNWISGPEARTWVQELRAAAGAVLVGAGTVLADDPRLTCRIKTGRQPLRVVLDTDLRTPPRARVVTGPGRLLVLTASRDAKRRAALERAGAEVMVLPARGGLLDWRLVLAELHRRGVLSVLVEGGATVASSALEAGVLDKLHIVHAPLLLGPGKGLTEAAKPRPLARAIRLRRVSHRVFGDDVVTTGYLEAR